jgi:Ring finger domain
MSVFRRYGRTHNHEIYVYDKQPSYTYYMSRSTAFTNQFVNTLLQQLSGQLPMRYDMPDAGTSNTTNRSRPSTQPSSATAAPQSPPQHSDRRSALLDFDDMMYQYHRNILEYNRNIRLMVDGVLSNRTFSYNGVHEINEMNQRYNDSMRGYTDTVNASLNLYRDIYFSANRGGVGAAAIPTVIPSNIPLLQVPTTRPSAFISYTVYPMVAPVQEANDQPLTDAQVTQFTEEYMFHDVSMAPTEGSDRQHFCPISLDLFQEGDSILRIRQCRHEFKSEPLRQWFRRSSKCPLCRCNLLNPAAAAATVPVPEPEPEQVVAQPPQQEHQEETEEVPQHDDTSTSETTESSAMGLIRELLSGSSDTDGTLLQTLFRGMDMTPIESIDITYTVDTFNNPPDHQA